MQTVNIGILAHVDAGKTSLTERLLYDTGVIDRLGSVDAGTTITDTGDIERRRGITIRSAVAAFRLGDRQVNLIDTPGHSDFVAEVERALGVLDGAILVLSAVEGVQPHSRRLMRILRALRLPTLIFVNKIDRMGARTDGLVADVRRLLTPAAVPLGTVRAPGTAAAVFQPYEPSGALVVAPTGGTAAVGTPIAVATPGVAGPAEGTPLGAVPAAATRAVGAAPAAVTPAVGAELGAVIPAVGTPAFGTLVEALAEQDDELLAALVDELPIDPDRVRKALRAQTAAGLAHPLLFGSALSGAGVPELLDAVADLLPPAPPAEDGLRARVFAVSREGGERVAYLRSYGGELRERARVPAYHRGADGGVTAARARPTRVEVVGPGAASRVLTAGLIARVSGLSRVRLGDQLGTAAGLDGAGPLHGPPGPPGLDGQTHFPAPTLESVVRPRDSAQVTALHAALLDLADADPFIRTRVAADGGSSVLLYGEVQREVLAATLAEAYGIEVEFAPATLLHVERPVGVGSAVEIIGHGFFGTVGLRVEPGSGVDYRLAVELGSLPLSFHKAIEDTVRAALEQGCHGWPVTDVTVTLTHSGYWSPISTAGHFRDVTPHVLMLALAQARTRVFEPCRRFEAEIPADRLGAVTSYLAGLEARLDGTTQVPAGWLLSGSLPARLEPEAQRRLPDLSSGEGLWSSVPDGDRPVVGVPPTRPRTDGNPFDRVEYLRFLARRDL
ncbi:GTP-binding protein [Plantactinospora siamensis]|uniref:GTP-binding protein n=1 Tax=Plantactinospora siamensis TaxID=555372 RepID=A0ABV6NQU4_9ACTN